MTTWIGCPLCGCPRLPEDPDGCVCMREPKVMGMTHCTSEVNAHSYLGPGNVEDFVDEYNYSLHSSGPGAQVFFDIQKRERKALQSAKAAAGLRKRWAGHPKQTKAEYNRKQRERRHARQRAAARERARKAAPYFYGEAA